MPSACRDNHRSAKEPFHYLKLARLLRMVRCWLESIGLPRSLFALHEAHIRTLTKAIDSPDFPMSRCSVIMRGKFIDSVAWSGCKLPAAILPSTDDSCTGTLREGYGCSATPVTKSPRSSITNFYIHLDVSTGEQTGGLAVRHKGSVRPDERHKLSGARPYRVRIIIQGAWL